MKKPDHISIPAHTSQPMPAGCRLEILSTHEPWSSWVLEDGTFLRAKVVARSVERIAGPEGQKYRLNYTMVLDW
jgi:hypothetical protein